MAPTSDRISDIQTALSRGGYYSGDPSGKWDADTVDAVQKFQSSNGLDMTGKLDALTLQKLGLGSDVAGVSAPKGITPHSCCSITPSPSYAPPGLGCAQGGARRAVCFSRIFRQHDARRNLAKISSSTLSQIFALSS